MYPLTEYERFSHNDLHKSRHNLRSLASLITYTLYLCNGANRYVPTEKVAGQATRTYGESFVTRIDGKKVPDTCAVVVALQKAREEQWRYVKGDRMKGWKLTNFGLRFAKEVERRIRTNLIN